MTRAPRDEAAWLGDVGRERDVRTHAAAHARAVKNHGRTFQKLAKLARTIDATVVAISASHEAICR